MELEEEYIKSICDDIIKFKPDLVITEKGISGENLKYIYFYFKNKKTKIFLYLDLAQHYLVKANITAIRRLRKSDNNRIAR